MYTISFYNIDRDTFSTRAEPGPAATEDVESDRLLGILQRMTLLEQTGNSAAPRLEIRSDLGLYEVSPSEGGLLVSELEPAPGQPRRMTPYETLLLLSPGIDSDGGGTPPLTLIARTTKTYRYASFTFIALGLALLAYSLFATFGPQTQVEESAPLQALTDKAEAAQQFAILSGTFSTGLEPGDRTMTISEDGSLKLRLVGSNGRVEQELDLKATPARRGQKLFLVLSNGGILEPQSRDVLDLYGDIYRRVN